LEIIRFLVEKGADVNSKYRKGATPLHAAVLKSDFKIIWFLVEKGADVNSKNRNGATPLHAAVLKSDLEIIWFLVENGADVNGKDQIGITPLYAAIENNNLDIIRFLVEKGADVNSKDYNHRTPLFFIFQNKNPLETFKLLYAETKLNTKDKHGESLIEHLIRNKCKDFKDVIECCLKEGVNINYGNILYLAIQSGYEYVDMLLQSNLNINCLSERTYYDLYRYYHENIDCISKSIKHAKSFIGEAKEGPTREHRQFSKLINGRFFTRTERLLYAYRLLLSYNINESFDFNQLENIDRLKTKNGNNLIHVLKVLFKINSNENQKTIIKIPERLSLEYASIDNIFPDIGASELKFSYRIYKGIPIYIALEMFRYIRGKKDKILSLESTDMVTEYGNTITHIECSYFSDFYTISQKTVKARNKNGWTPLFSSNYHGNDAAKGVLIYHKANYHDIDYYGNMPNFYSK
jgi:ankyrin repeat protein